MFSAAPVGWTLTNHQLPLVEFRLDVWCSAYRLDFNEPPTAIGGIPTPWRVVL
jgi:hypothetical protein